MNQTGKERLFAISSVRESWKDISYLFFYFSCLSGLNYWYVCVVQLLPLRTTTVFSFSLNIQQGGLRKGYTMHIYRCVCCCMHYFSRIPKCIVCVIYVALFSFFLSHWDRKKSPFLNWDSHPPLASLSLPDFIKKTTLPISNCVILSNCPLLSSPLGAVQKWCRRGEEGGGSDRLVTNSSIPRFTLRVIASLITIYFLYIVILVPTRAGLHQNNTLER